jgi:hypothetical protein
MQITARYWMLYFTETDEHAIVLIEKHSQRVSETNLSGTHSPLLGPLYPWIAVPQPVPQSTFRLLTT